MGPQALLGEFSLETKIVVLWALGGSNDPGVMVINIPGCQWSLSLCNVIYQLYRRPGLLGVLYNGYDIVLMANIPIPFLGRGSMSVFVNILHVGCSYFMVFSTAPYFLLCIL